MKLHVEHEVIGGKKVVEKFEDVESFMDPPMTNTILVKFEGDRDNRKLDYGNVVKAESQ
jgi:hypothetical protein